MGKSSIEKHKFTGMLIMLLLCVCIVRLVVSGIVLSGSKDNIFVRSSDVYMAMSETISKPEAVEANTPPLALVSPGYPFFLKAVTRPFQNDIRFAVFFQVITSTLSVLGVYLLSVRIWQSTRVAFWASLLYALDFSSFYYSQVIMPETVFTFLLIVAMLLSVSLFRPKTPKIRVLTGFGLLLILAAFINDRSYFLYFYVTAVLACLWAREKRGFKPVGRWISLLLVLWMVLVGGWQLRNFFVDGTWQFSVNRHRELLYERGAGIYADLKGVDLQQARETIAAELSLPEDTPLSLRSKVYKTEGWRLLSLFPDRAIKSGLIGVGKMIASVESYEIFQYFGLDKRVVSDMVDMRPEDFLKKWLTKETFWSFFRAMGVIGFMMGYLVVVYFGTCCAVLRMFKRRLWAWTPHVFLWFLIGFFVFIATIPSATAIYRIPIMPFLTVYAAMGLDGVLARRKTYKPRPPGGKRSYQPQHVLKHD